MKIETKVIIGTAAFFGIILLIGWVALNEEGRMASFTTQYEARSMERGAMLFENNCSTCHGDWGQGIPGRAPALNNPALFNGDRLVAMGWEGTLDDYIANAVAAGRPNSGSYWNNNIMPTWGQEFGGPMRPDQVRDVARYVMNWEGSALDEAAPPTVLQDFKLPGDQAAAEDAAAEPAGGLDVAALLAELPEGDHSAGTQLYTNLGCTGCHLAGAIAPLTEGTATRAAERTTTVPELAGYSPEQYILESILAPNNYIVADSPSYVDGNGNSLMPANYRDLIDDQGLADVLAYLLTQTQ